jgi:hypothetical protein
LLGVTLKDDQSRRQFLADLAKQGDLEAAILMQQFGAAAVGAAQLGGDELKAIAQLFQTRLLEVVQKVVTGAEAKMGGRPTDPASREPLQKAVSEQVGRLFEKDTLGLVALVLSPKAPDDPVEAEIKASRDPILTGVLQGLAVELSLLRARLQFVARLKALHDARRPLPGPGRIDAFNGIRDRVFPVSDAMRLAPVGSLSDWMPGLLYDPAPASGPANPENVVGTDPNRAVNFAENMISPPGIPNSVESLAILQKLLYVGANIGPWQATRLIGDRNETWRATGKYPGRPLTATWAAAPYLHNDSVPTVYDLLRPVAQRPATFRRGGRRFDPQKVGYEEPGPGEPGFVFDTAKSGNRNVGHEYGTDLNEDDRWALIEYLKTK